MTTDKKSHLAAPWQMPDLRVPECRNCFMPCGNCPKEAATKAELLLAVAKRVRKLETALQRIKENADAWHGSEGLDTGHDRALHVISEWCDEALARD